MSNTNHFLAASRCQLRFATTRGLITTEDLWQLSLKNLDAIAVSVDGELSKTSRKSFLENPDPKVDAAAKENELRMEILKEIISIRQEENKASLAESVRVRQKAFLKDLLEKKKIGAMESKTIEEIEAELAALG